MALPHVEDVLLVDRAIEPQALRTSATFWGVARSPQHGDRGVTGDECGRS
jgi:hypothetical protein